MANVAFGVRQTANGIGTTDTDIRHMLAQKWLNKGIVGGLQVSGGSTMAYNVSAGMAICSRGASDGFTEAYWSGGATPTVEANSSSNPRIDVVWITAHDMSQGDTDNLVTIGVTKGTAAASPSAPTIPTYATEVARMLLPGGSTTTKNATVNASRPFSIPYGASLGILADIRDKTSEVVSVENPSWKTRASATVVLSSDRMLEVSYARTATTHDFSKVGSIVVDIVIDGVSLATSEIAFSGAWETKEFREIIKVDAGTHTIVVRDGWHEGAAIDFIASKSGYATANVGMRVLVVDRGVAV